MDINEILTKEALAEVTEKSDLMAWWMVFCQWAAVIGIFVVVAVWTNPLTILAGTLLLGGRHLGFGVLAHDCGHKSLFRTAMAERNGGELAAHTATLFEQLCLHARPPAAPQACGYGR